MVCAVCTLALYHSANGRAACLNRCGARPKERGQGSLCQTGTYTHRYACSKAREQVLSSRVFSCVRSGYRATEESSRPADREERLWERSERLWERELARWDSERRAWDAREAQLLEQIADLQHQLLRFTHTQAQPALAQRAEAQRVPAQLAAPAPALVQDGQAYSAQQAPEGLQESHAATVAPSAPLPDPEEVAAAIHRGASGAVRTGQSASEQFLEGDLDMEGPAPFAEDFAAAMDAVNSSDVLGDWQDVLRGKVGCALAGMYIDCRC